MGFNGLELAAFVSGAVARAQYDVAGGRSRIARPYDDYIQKLQRLTLGRNGCVVVGYVAPFVRWAELHDLGLA